MLSEFDLIKQYFQRRQPARALLGIGDDCALIAPEPGAQLAISTSNCHVILHRARLKLRACLGNGWAHMGDEAC